MVAIQSLLALASAAGIASAHFTLDSPPTRGFDEDQEPNGPCGGFTTITNRTAFGASGGTYQINSRHASASVQLLVSADGQTFPSQPITSYTVTGLGTVCGNIPGSLLSGAGLKAGDNFTLQIVYKSGTESSSLYQCADLTLAQGSVTSSGTCVNGTNVQVSNVQFGQARQSGSASASSAAAGSARPSASASASAARTTSGAASGRALTALSVLSAALLTVAMVL
jgi:hypothetical protein